MKRRLVWTAVLLLLALAVRAPALTERSWWIDELITRDIGRLPFFRPGAFSVQNYFTHSIVAFAIHDTGPGPLMYWLEGLFAYYAEPMGGEYWLRFPGIAAGLLSTVLMAFCMWRHAGAAAAIFAGVLAAVLPAWVGWSTGARGYSWAVLCALLQVFLSWQYLHLRKRGVFLLLYGFTSTAGVLVHPFHVIFNVAAWLAMFSVKPFRKAGLITAGALLLLVQAAWLLLWLRAVQQVSSVGVRAAHWNSAALQEALVKLITTDWSLCLSLVALSLAGAAATWKFRRPEWRFIGMLAAVMGVLGLLLALVMSVRLFAAGRYFYAASVPATILAGCVFQRLIAWIRLRFGNRFTRPVVQLSAATLILLLGLPAYRQADTPVHDWAAVVAWLRGNSGPGDVVLTGPNSEYEVYRVYAQAAGVPATAPVTISNRRGNVISVQTPLAVQALLKSERRLWFVTAFYGQHRSPEYWRLIGKNFREQRRFPGKADLVVFSNR